MLVIAELADPLILQHAGMQEILVDRCQLILESSVEEFNDFCVAFHGGLRKTTYACQIVGLLEKSRKNTIKTIVYDSAKHLQGD